MQSYVTITLNDPFATSTFLSTGQDPLGLTLQEVQTAPKSKQTRREISHHLIPNHPIPQCEGFGCI